MWTIHGTVRPLFIAEPDCIDWGQHSIDLGPLPPQRIHLQFTRPVSHVTVHSSNSSLTTTLVGRDGIPGEYLLNVAAPGIQKLGPVAAEITLRAVTPDGTPLPAKALSVRGVLVSDLEATPSLIALGAREENEVCTDNVIVESRTHKNLRVVSIKAIGRGLSAKVVGIPGEPIELLVRQQIVAQEATNSIELYPKRVTVA